MSMKTNCVGSSSSTDALAVKVHLGARNPENHVPKKRALSAHMDNLYSDIEQNIFKRFVFLEGWGLIFPKKLNNLHPELILLCLWNQSHDWITSLLLLTTQKHELWLDIIRWHISSFCIFKSINCKLSLTSSTGHSMRQFFVYYMIITVLGLK